VSASPQVWIGGTTHFFGRYSHWFVLYSKDQIAQEDTDKLRTRSFSSSKSESNSWVLAFDVVAIVISS
jgi:hypothetical protein